MRRKGFTLVELMVVVAIIAILAAVAVPMYTKFQQKSRVGTVIKAAMGTMQPFQEWYGSEETFAGLAVDPATAPALTFRGPTIGGTTANVGVNLPDVEGVTWGHTFSANKVIITWTFASRCPAADCPGQFCLHCQDTGCFMQIEMVAGSSFATLNKDPESRGACTM